MKASKPEQARSSGKPQRGLDDLVLVLVVQAGRRAAHHVVMHVQDARRLPQPFQQHAQPEEIHRRVVQHRAAHQAQAQLRRLADVAVKAVAVLLELRAGLLADEPQETVRWWPARCRC